MYLPGNAHRAMEALGVASVVRDHELPDQTPGLQGSHRADLVRGRPGRGTGEAQDHAWRSPEPTCTTRSARRLDGRRPASGCRGRGRSTRMEIRQGWISPTEAATNSTCWWAPMASTLRPPACRQGLYPSPVGQVSWRFIVNVTRGPEQLDRHARWRTDIPGNPPRRRAASTAISTCRATMATDPTHGDPGRLEDLFGDFDGPAIDLIRAANRDRHRPLRPHRGGRHGRLGERPGCPGG